MVRQLKTALARPATDRELHAMRIYHRMHALFGAFAIVLVLLLIGDSITRGQGASHLPFDIAILAITLVFVFEFVLRVVIAPSTWGYLRKNWWQILLLVLPFLSVLRVFMALRVARAGRVMLAAQRGTHTASEKLRDRVTWLATITAIVVLTAADLLIEYGRYPKYPQALHDAAMTTITGNGLPLRSGGAQAIDPILAIYSVVVFAGLAASLGAFFLEHGRGGESGAGGGSARLSGERLSDLDGDPHADPAGTGASRGTRRV